MLVHLQYPDPNIGLHLPPEYCDDSNSSSPRPARNEEFLQRNIESQDDAVNLNSGLHNYYRFAPIRPANCDIDLPPQYRDDRNRSSLRLARDDEFLQRNIENQDDAVNLNSGLHNYDRFAPIRPENRDIDLPPQYRDDRNRSSLRLARDDEFLQRNIENQNDEVNLDTGLHNYDMIAPIRPTYPNIDLPPQYHDDRNRSSSSNSSSNSITVSDDDFLLGNIEALDDEVDLVSNRKRFDCAICMETIRKREGVTLRDCLHEFCKYDSNLKKDD